MNPVKPELLAIIICRGIVPEADGSATIRNAMWSLNVPETPCVLRDLYLYLVLTSVHGDAKPLFRISFDGNTVFEALIPMGSESPRDYYIGVIDLTGVKIAQLGDYDFDVIWNGDYLASRRLRVKQSQ